MVLTLQLPYFGVPSGCVHLRTEACSGSQPSPHSSPSSVGSNIPPPLLLPPWGVKSLSLSLVRVTARDTCSGYLLLWFPATCPYFWF